MKSCFRGIVTVVVAFYAPAALVQGQPRGPGQTDVGAGGPERAYDRPGGPSAGDRQAASKVSLSEEPGGGLILVVDYPWKVHAKPSVEVRLLGQGEPDDLKVQPMYFRWKFMKGKTTVAVYRCQDQCESVPTSAQVIEDDVEFEVLGDRNSLGTPAICVARQVVRKGATVRGGPVIGPGAAAAFPLLQPWAVDKRLLYFDLPEEYFADAGRMRVWFLRDDRVLWSQAISWPGIDKQKKGKP